MCFYCRQCIVLFEYLRRLANIKKKKKLLVFNNLNKSYIENV